MLTSPGSQLTAGYGNLGVNASTFLSDHVLLAPYTWSPQNGWIRPHTLSGVDHSASPPAMLNTAERDVFVSAVESQLLPSPDDGKRTVKVNVSLTPQAAAILSISGALPDAAVNCTGSVG